MKFQSRLAVYMNCYNTKMLSQEVIKEFGLNWVGSNTSRKFIQVYVDKEPYMRASCRINHSFLLELLLTEFNIKYETRRVDRWEIPLKIPLEKGERYNLIGAGRLVKIGNDIILNGNSIDYGIGPSLEHLLKIKKFTKLNIFDAKTYKKEKPISEWYNIEPNL